MDTTGAPAGLQTCPVPAAGTPPWPPTTPLPAARYPAFVSLILVPPLLAAARSRKPRLVRAGALLVLLGALFAILSFPVSLAPASWAGGLRFVNYAAVLGYVAGLAVFWFSGLISQPIR